ncbi:MAG: ABC transporter ATP-binding protein [Candidatus Rokubacteria bacterium]|nr:ABC transporter ATP-binding protein [Candidatus Rokubacteria bacterium]MBI3106147.1 ABC transporter ATP-binding protein [Candidatus Rokubacteria bacterium]
MALLEARNISKRFGGLQANRDLSLDVSDGEIVGLIGPNGAGKTTFFNIVAGVYRPDTGSLRFRGREITGARPHVVSRLGIARTFQIPRPFDTMTVIDNVLVGLVPRAGAAAADREARALVAAVGLTEKADALASSLSTGQRKRLELARALATRPSLLLLDEVTGGVDQRSIPGLVELVRSVRARGVTLLVVEHNMRVMASLADRIVALNLGAKIAEGRPAEVARDAEVVRTYLGDTFVTETS